MSEADQLELIAADGQIRFFDLDPQRGVTNIGRHPENDIVIDHAGVALFQAVLDHRRKPYTLVVLSEEGEVQLDGRRLTPGQPTPLKGWDTFSFDGLSLVFVERDETSRAPTRRQERPAVTVAVMPPGAAQPTFTSAAPSSQSASFDVSEADLEQAHPADKVHLNVLPPDISDEIILAQLSDRTLTVDAGQSVAWNLTIINGGPLVASMRVTVAGLNPSWVEVSPSAVNLNEGERTTVMLTVSPPRLPTSRAGQHHFAILITSPDYPGHVHQLGATLTINPFYDFAVSELSPRQQTVGWHKRVAVVNVHILNRGNNEAVFRLSGEDDPRACSFEFQPPGEVTSLARQADVYVQPEETLSVPVRITPNRRMLIGLRKAMYALTVTAQPLDGQQSARSVLGQLYNAPLIGPWLILLLVLLFGLLIVAIFRPWIGAFTVSRLAINEGEASTLSWQASPFAEVRLEPNPGVPLQSQGSLEIRPKDTTQYRLYAENLLTRLFPPLAIQPVVTEVVVNPLIPVSNQFDTDRKEVVVGESVIVYWDVVGADSLVLTTNGAPDAVPTTQHVGQRVVRLESDTVFGLQASNRHANVPRSVTVRVKQPTPTPVPTPAIIIFDVNPKIITQGQEVRIDWQVLGVSEVQISGIVGANTFPSQGSINQSPQQSTVYVLSAGIGDARVSRQWEVRVNPAPPPPQAPTIVFFTASPNEVVRGSPQAAAVSLVWSVLTPTTNVQLSGPALASPIDNLPEQGTITLGVDRTTLFVLTAFNGDLKTSRTVDVRIVEPTPTPPPTPTPFPPPRILFLRVEDSNGNVLLPSASGTYQVTYNTVVRLSWQVEGASLNVQLYRDGTSLGGQPATGSSAPLQITRATRFQLEASNPGGTTNAFVTIDLLPRPIPMPPFNVNLSNETQSSVTLNWDYNPADVGNITGFRVYRAPIGSTNFQLVAAEYPVGSAPALNAFSRSWTDTAAPVCGYTYYVVAAWVDTFGVPQETSAGSPSVATQPCVVNTP
ncbi:MAG: FHA domain-containing protein [Anaerolineae bacterium]|nr:FHA domain-containing protein [Thermoflexales bacterium]MDW8406735.1 FHA domain-containing protein [Anaerolineae bacterium]